MAVIGESRSQYLTVNVSRTWPREPWARCHGGTRSLMLTDFALLPRLDADPYIPGGNGAQWYVNQNNFFRSVRNFVIDLRNTPASATSTGIHWQVSQATSLMNIVFEMSTAAGNAHQGLWMENGSGGYMGGTYASFHAYRAIAEPILIARYGLQRR